MKRLMRGQTPNKFIYIKSSVLIKSIIKPSDGIIAQHNLVFNKSLFSTIYKYSIFDFYDSKHKYLFELKSSKYSYSKYPTILIQTNKGLCENSVFIFSFICGYLCYIQYNKKM